MRERINRLARGILTAETPELSVSPESLDGEVRSGEVLRTSVSADSENGVHLKGLVYSDGVFLGPDPNPGDYESADAYEEALLEKQSMETYSAIGGGQCRTTVFGLAAAYAAIANHGLLVEPHLIKASSLYRDEPLTPYIGEDPKEVCGFDVAEKILDMMEGVTSDGTGKTMALESYRVCSKTGTARQLSILRIALM